jgi:hypothetical protein
LFLGLVRYEAYRLIVDLPEGKTMSWATDNTAQNDAAALVLSTLTAALGTTEGLAAVAAITALEAANAVVKMPTADCREHARRVVLCAIDETVWGTGR